MKAQIISYPPPPREVVVTMSEEEARALYRGLTLDRFTTIISGLYYALHDAGIR